MLVYPNQKIVKVHKAPADRNHLYGVLNKEAAMNALRNLTPNEMKVFFCLALNQPEYEMALSTAYVAEKTGANLDSIRTAVRGLIKKGYLVENHGNHYDFYEVSQNAEEKIEKIILEEKSVKTTDNAVIATEKSSVHVGEKRGEIIKKEYIKNTSKYNEDLSDYDSLRWDEVFKWIKVKRHKHSLKQLQEAAGEKLDVNVVRRIVSQNWPAFEKRLEEKEGYRFKMLVNLTGEQYNKWSPDVPGSSCDQKFSTASRSHGLPNTPVPYVHCEAVLFLLLDWGTGCCLSTM